MGVPSDQGCCTSPARPCRVKVRHSGSIGAVEEPELEALGQFEFEIKCALYFSGCLYFSTTPSLHKIALCDITVDTDPRLGVS